MATDSSEQKIPHFYSKALKSHLDGYGIKQNLLVPVSAYSYLSDKANSLSYHLPALDLQHFDNINFETLILEELFDEQKEEPVSGEALLPCSEVHSSGELVYKWTYVTVYSYDDESMLWTVSPDIDPDERIQVTRLRLIIDDENLEVFARRIWEALNLRRDAENRMRYNLYVDFTLLNGLYHITTFQYKVIASKVTTMKLRREMYPESLDLLKTEVKLLFKRVEAELNFREIIKRNPEKFSFIRVPEPEWIRPAPLYNMVPTLFGPIKDVKEKLGIHYLWSEPNATKAILIVNRECLKVEEMCIFSISRRNLQLDDFTSEQQMAIDVTLKYLHLRWLPLVCNAIRWLFQDIKKGWYNIHEHNWQMYDFSKLCRFMQLVRFRMQYSLRYMLRTSIELYIKLLVTPCRLTFDCTDDYEWDPADLIHSPFSTAKSLFLLGITMDSSGPKYTTAPEQFGVTILKFLRDVLYKCHFIKQVHPIIMTNLRFDKDLYLTSLGLLEDCSVVYRDCLEHAYQKAIIPLNAYCRCFEAYFEFSELDIPSYVEEFHAENHNVYEIREEIQKHHDAKERLVVDLPHTIIIGPFIVNVDKFKKEMIKKREKTMNALLSMFTADEKMFLEDIIMEFKSVARKLAEPPNSIENIYEIREWMETIPYTVMVQEDMTRRVRSDYYIVLDHFFVALDNEEFALLWEAVGWPNKLATLIEETEEYLLEETDKFLKLHQMDEQILMDKVDIFTSQIKELTMQKDITKVHEIANDIKKAWKGIKETQEFGSLLNRRQKLFNIPVTPFEELNSLIKEFEPYRNLWVTASEFYEFYNIWMFNPLIQVDVEPIETLVNDYIKTLSKCVKSFGDLPLVQGVAIKIRGDLEEFKRYLPVLLAVKNPGMKEKHWQEVNEKTGLSLTMGPKQTFKMCLDQGVAEFCDLITHIGEAASKEFAIEQALDKMMQEWQDKNLELMPYKNTGTFIMKVADETMQMLNDHLMLTQQLNFSPFKAAFEGKINSWNEKLLLTLAVLETWIECQKQWMYLEPIFTSEDITKELPLESKKYRTMEGTWRRIMASTNELPKIMIVCPSQNLLESLQEATMALGMAAKGLSEYMELKRCRFPRLFFLSDDELLGILARAREPLAVQPHLRKCFENIAMLTFEEDRLITEIHSMEGEVVPLKNRFYPTGNVEDWLSLLEDTMVNTVRLILLDCSAEIYIKPRAEWVLCWPGQAVIACSQCWWTGNVEESIVKKRIAEFYVQVLENLDSLRQLAKTELTFLQRDILFPLIVIEVHARDITKELVDVNVKSSFDFEWICQLRYYIEDYTIPTYEPPPGTILEEGEVSPLDTSEYYREFELKAMYVKALNTRFPYYNEYLGNSGRLVITPLTDRCYLTLMGAMHLKFGGAPAGPAGTGKTETTKASGMQFHRVQTFPTVKRLRYWLKERLPDLTTCNGLYRMLGRLVITPLTDRCYLTLMGAMHLKFGGAPAGPAGTGKTETTKDLAKALAVQCVVFNCSDQLDYLAMGKFFKGLASSGAWACFDEFNRIDIEVLSVIAQQVVSIQRAQMQHLTRFVFEGSEIGIKASAAVFITMNPGYAGRSELPDNLKALFRPVAMMVPNFALIVEISLFSYGFGDAKMLAIKVVYTFKLCMEQLSPQDHYDFAMRAVKTVITVAGNLLRQLEGLLTEKQIVLKALKDVNVPKFLSNDLILFNGIISDLFPLVDNPEVEYGILEKAIRIWTVKKGCETIETFVFKTIQYYETIFVRHGVMLVGPAGAGKTKCYQVLQAAITSLKGQLSPDGKPFTPVHTFTLNPKSITMGQLYGGFDDQTHEWTDGILSSLVRLGIEAEDKDKRWYIFDGPVDAIWIENMNTVLDDNKKLCLSSGEIMKMTDHQRMVFEVEDLAVASPATVSRCGMVYLDTTTVGIRPIVNVWLKTSIPSLATFLESQFRSLFETYLYPSLIFLRSNMKELLTSTDPALVIKFLELLSWRLRPLLSKDGRPPPNQNHQKNMVNLAPSWVVWCLVWSVGATCDNDSRVKFSTYLKGLMAANKEKVPFPADGLVYNYRMNDGGFTDPTDDGEPTMPYWKHWMEGVEKVSVTLNMNFTDIEVPTIDMVRSMYLLNCKLLCLENVLCIGPPGSGKTLTANSRLQKSPLASLVCNFIMFSAGTNANETQDLIESKLEKRGRGVLGPPLMKKQVFFIDDLNMPAREVFGAQPPLELLRQWTDFEGWYDRRNIGDFIRIIDMCIVGAMAPPGGGRQPVSMRLLRHFHYLAFTDMTDDSKREIFGTIFKPWMEKTEGFSALLSNIIEASLQVFSSIVSDLLPTPTKCHYMFNLRDLAKVFQGMFMLEPHTIKHHYELVKLWYHENVRVYQDRLVNDADRSWFTNLLREKVRNVFNMDPALALGNEVICFADFMDITSDERKYVRVTNMDEMEGVLMNYLAEYNSMSTAPMNLVLFDDAISHICRISRILRQPMGNCLLLGMGGSGRQSLSRVACHMAEMVFFQVEISKTYSMNDWRDDIKKAMLKAGYENRTVMFLFSDFQIKMESFLEDINNILSAGDVPNIYVSEDLEKIYSGLRHAVMEAGLPVTKANLFSFYQKRVRCNLHMVICMSPIGEIFRARMRQFPSLINCCTVDWFSEWPESALRGVARGVLLEVPSLKITEEQLEGVVKMCQFAHQSVVRISELFLKQLGRNNYVTPASYLELLKSFAELYEKKKGFIGGQYLALKTGLDKLYITELDVRQLQIDLANLKPVMEKAAVEMRKVIDRIAIDTAIAEEAKSEVEKEQSSAMKIKEATEALAADAEKDLAEALPALQAAEDSLKALNKGDIVEVKAMKSPPQGVVKVIEAICIIYKITPLKVQGSAPGEKVLDYWKPGTAALFSDAGAFLDSLMRFDKDSITEAMIKSLKKYIVDPAFEPEKIKKVSKACMSLCQWVHAIYIYYHVNLNVLPKKAALAEANKQLAITEAIVNAAKAKMQKVMDGLEVLNNLLRQKEAESAKTEAEIQLCLARMDRAVRLISGLGSEKVRWIQRIAELEEDLVNITGDILLSSCAVAYMTPFTDKFRVMLYSTWDDKISEYKVPRTAGCSVISVLGDPVMIREWQIYGLPLDTMSTESAVLVANSKRWPLFIDPQGQANHWIKTMCKQDGLIICQPNDRNIIQQFEAAIRFGKPILLENVLETLDNSLDTIIKKQLFTQAGQVVIKVGDSIIPYANSFKLYITTRMANPLYSPEVSVKLQIVNFALVESGLQEQLLSIAVATERAELEQQRVALVINRAQMASQLSSMQTRILTKLVESQGSPVDDIELIETLEAIKIKSKEISIKVQEAEVTQGNLDSARKVYIPVAERGRVLFFCLSDFSAVDPMYQFSLGWFIRIYVKSMTNTEPDEDIEIRLTTIIDFLTLSCYTESCRGLFQRHRVHFAFLLSIRILMQENRINLAEYHFFLNGGTCENTTKNPDPDWITDKMWQEILSLDSLDNFKQLVSNFSKNLKDFRAIYDSNNPHKVPLPFPYNETYVPFQKLLVLKTLRLDRLTNGVQDFIEINLGKQFIEPLSMDLFAVYAESAPNTPLIFVLSTGTDPAEDLFKLTEKMKMTKRFQSVSLGQGQGARAEAMFKVACTEGNWLFFQNCHLSPSWMPNLELLVESISPETVHKDFRIWLTSMPSPAFPVVLLQNGIKMTIEPPRGVKANILKAYTNQITDVLGLFTDPSQKAITFKWLLFSLCIFHSVVLERNKFGRLGFNVPYEFSDGDLKICIQQLRMFVMEYAVLPIKMLIYVSGQINYGGRVTEEWDRRCLMAILSDHYDHKVLSQSHAFDDHGVYHQLPSNATINDYLNYVQTLPLNDDPGIFGLHANANISYAQSESMACIMTLQICQGSASDTGGGEEDTTERVAQEILKMLPQPFNLKDVMEKYQVSYNESLNSVLIQETTQYNKLLNIIASTLRDLLKALKGLLVMSEILENIVSSLGINTVPNYWAGKAYPSLKPLGSWVKDLVARLEFMKSWVVGGIPTVFWISGFYTPQRLLTAVLQNYARKNVISIDTIEYEFTVVKDAPKGKVVDMCFIRGLYLEGARWNSANSCVDESRPKELLTELPLVQLKPVLRGVDTSHLYDCPAYRTKLRKQFILAIKLDPGTQSSQHWIKRGTALLGELDY